MPNGVMGEGVFLASIGRNANRNLDNCATANKN
jgi:hypothetical protein